MAKETKSLGQKDILDRFFTKPEIAIQCINFISNIDTYDCIIEPSAGNGSFSTQLLNCFAYIHGLSNLKDLISADENSVGITFDKLDKKQFNEYKNILVIGNPPFGQQNTLAIRFFNEAAKFANTIAFILPLSFKKDSIILSVEGNVELLNINEDYNNNKFSSSFLMDNS